MATGPPNDMYLLGRDKEESNRYELSFLLSPGYLQPTENNTDWHPLISRLNAQHKFLVELSDSHSIHPSIPKDRLFSVADIATGTGYAKFLPISYLSCHQY